MDRWGVNQIGSSLFAADRAVNRPLNHRTASEALGHAVVAEGLAPEFDVLRLDHLEAVALEERAGGDAGLGEQPVDAVSVRMVMDVIQQDTRDASACLLYTSDAADE